TAPASSCSHDRGSRSGRSSRGCTGLQTARSFGYTVPVTPTALLGEAVEQAVAAGGDQIGLAATPRHVGRVPRGVAAAGTIVMTEHGAAEGAARPIVAGEIEILRPSPALRSRVGQHVVL